MRPKMICFLIHALVMQVIAAQNAFAQKKLINQFFSSTPDSTRSASFLPLPVLGYAQETGFEFGVAPMYSFYTERTDTLTRSSSITGMATYTTEKQSNFFIKSDLWLPFNKFHITSELRYQNFPFQFYGVGDHTRETDREMITQKLFRASGEVEKQMAPGAYTGAAFSYEKYRYEMASQGPFLPNPYGVFDRDGGQVLYLGLSQILDSRNNNTYTTRGTFIKLAYSYAPDVFGGDNFTGSSTKVDVRTFKSFDSKKVLGVQGIYKSLQGSRAPFYLMPQLGDDSMMRGYYTGRYRDQNMLALQTEFRYRFIPRLGAAAFAAAGTVYGNRQLNFRDIKPALGAGVRYFFDIDRGLSVRVDYAVGEKPAGEKRLSGFYLSLGEAF
ncbi:MAG TPA: polymerase [Sphingobacteriaceae bacterium]